MKSIVSFAALFYKQVTVFTGKRFLIVDDEPDIREILADELRFEGAEVFEAHNGKAAENILLQTPADKKFDVVITDIRMPGGDGLSLAKAIQEMPDPKPVVFLVTGFADVPPAEAYDIGAEGYFTKPFPLELLKREISRMLMPTPQRWKTSLTQQPQNMLRLQFNFQESCQRKQVVLGRAGMFVRGHTAVATPGQTIQVVWAEDEWISGIVRWVRADHKGAQDAGFGVEFLAMSDSLIHQLKEDRERIQPKAFIPLASGAAS